MRGCCAQVGFTRPDRVPAPTFRVCAATSRRLFASCGMARVGPERAMPGPRGRAASVFGGRSRGQTREAACAVATRPAGGRIAAGRICVSRPGRSAPTGHPTARLFTIASQRSARGPEGRRAKACAGLGSEHRPVGDPRRARMLHRRRGRRLRGRLHGRDCGGLFHRLLHIRRPGPVLGWRICLSHPASRVRLVRLVVTIARIPAIELSRLATCISVR